MEFTAAAIIQKKIQVHVIWILIAPVFFFLIDLALDNSTVSRNDCSLTLSLSLSILYPELSSFLLCMLDENEGLWKGLVLKVRK